MPKPEPSRHHQRHGHAYAAGARDFAERVKDLASSGAPLAAAQFCTIIDNVLAREFPMPAPRNKYQKQSKLFSTYGEFLDD